MEGAETDWHGHVTALTVAPEYRRIGLANQLMDELEDVSDNTHDAYFVDLFVRKSNDVAITMYKKLGYDVYRTVLGYYSGSDAEDAYGACGQTRQREKHKEVVGAVRAQKLERE